MNMENLLPVFSQEFAEYARASHVVAAIPIGKYLFFAFYTFVTGKHADIKSIFFGALIGLAGILIIFKRYFKCLGMQLRLRNILPLKLKGYIDVEEFYTA